MKRFPANLRRHLPVLLFSLFVLLVGLQSPSEAVVVLDSTWRQEKGSGKDWEGFGAHLRLAAEQPFRSVLALASDGETWGEASGTWIGNDTSSSYVLTAGHIFDLPGRADDYAIRGPDGRVLHADRLWIHPKWNGDSDARTGYDIAILRIPELLSGLGPQPALYSGEREAGQLITFVGYGSRGIGSTGQGDRFYRGSDKAAAQGVVDQWVALDRNAGKDSDAGNYLGIYLPKENGSIPNPYGGSPRPATRLVGLLGSGDSGGSAWMQSPSGWVIVGIASSGDGKARYGESSWFSRVSPHKEWIRRIFPGAKFAD